MNAMILDVGFVYRIGTMILDVGFGYECHDCSDECHNVYVCKIDSNII